MKIALYYDVKDWGHHPLYANLFCKALKTKGVKVFSVTSKMPKFFLLRKKANFKRNLLVLFVYFFCFLRNYCFKRFFFKRFGKAFIWFDLLCWIYIYESLINKKIDLVFLGMIDDFLVNSNFKIPAYDLFMKRPWAGIFIFPKFDINKKCYNLNCLSPLKNSNYFMGLFCLNELIIPKAKALIRKPVFKCPDVAKRFTNSKLKNFNEIKKAAAGKKIIGLLGVLDFRKGIIELADFAGSPQGNNYFFLVYGSPYDAKSRIEFNIFLQLLSPRADNIFVVEKKVSFFNFDKILNSVDVVWLCYKDFFQSSNLLTRAAFNFKPVVCISGNLIAMRVLKYRLGGVSNSFSFSDLNLAIKKALLITQKNGFRKYIKINSFLSLKILFSRLFITCFSKSVNTTPPKRVFR